MSLILNIKKLRRNKYKSMHCTYSLSSCLQLRLNQLFTCFVISYVKKMCTFKFLFPFFFKLKVFAFLINNLFYFFWYKPYISTIYNMMISLTAQHVSFIPLKNPILPLIKKSVRRNRNFSSSNFRKNSVSRNQSCI
jgi:hypothetical protein